jgi:hypothetical protein
MEKEKWPKFKDYFKFFLELFFKYLKKGKLKSYLGYAIGEIILVVIGILIAVKVGDINEKRSKEEDFKAALEIVDKDLQADIARITEVLEFWRNRDSIADAVLRDKVTLEDIHKDNYLLRNVINNCASVGFHVNGYTAISKMLENKPEGYDSILEALRFLMDSSLPSVVHGENDLIDIASEFAIFQRDNQDWSWMYKTDMKSAAKMDFQFYRKNLRYKSWVGYRLKKLHLLMIELVFYREKAYNLLIQIQGKSGLKQFNQALLIDLSRAKTTNLKKCKINDVKTNEFTITEREWGFAYSTLINNLTKDTLKVHYSNGESLRESYHQIVPGALNVIELPLNMNLLFFRNDVFTGCLSQTGFNQCVTIR